MAKKPVLTLVPLVLLGIPAALLCSVNWSSVLKSSEGPNARVPGPSTAGGELLGLPAHGGMSQGRVTAEREPASAWGKRRPAGGSGYDELAEVLRFDVSPGWIMDRWPWVSAGLADLGLQGYRVPLLTGTGQDALAGALTYYFNARQQVQRITLQGTTGEPAGLVALLVGRFRFGRRLTNDPGIIRYEVAEPKGPPKSYLEIRVAKPTDPARRYEVNLAIERPA